MENKSFYEEDRPWGSFTQFTYNESSTVKILRVNPAEMNSLQYHRHREELWVALDENLEVTIGDRVWQPKRFERIFISKGDKHRFKCIAHDPSYIMEVSFGDFDENDIVRLDDKYGR